MKQISSLMFLLVHLSDGLENCSTLDSSLSFKFACFGAVDYKFYVSDELDQDYLNKKAIALLNNTEYSILPTNCQVSIKKMICANVYRKCSPNIKIGDKGTYNTQIYSDILANLTKISTISPALLPSPLIPLPFQRPCKSVCTNVAKTCHSFLIMIDKNPDCLARMDYSEGALAPIYNQNSNLLEPFQYDQTSNDSICNAMNTDFTVQSSKEPYLSASNPKDFCYGLVNEVYIPPAQLIDCQLAPMQPSYFVQTLISNKLSTMSSELPVWLSKRCKISMRKYFCASTLLTPESQSMSHALVSSGYSHLLNLFPTDLTGYTFYLPSYPHWSICEEYVNACGEFIRLAGIPSLVPHCDAVSNGVSFFPTNNQTIKSIELSKYHIKINFTTSPNTMLSTRIEDDALVETRCPEGFVVPNRDDPRTPWITGSGCAMSCDLPLYSKYEWKTMKLEAMILTWIGFPMVLLFVITWLADKEKRKQYLVICFAISSMITTFTQVIVTSLPSDQSFCKTNAVPYDQTDGFNTCSAQALIFVFSGNATAVCWMLLAIDIFLKIVMDWRSTNRLMPYFLLFILLEPLSLLIFSSRANLGYIGFMPLCFVSSPDQNIVAVIPWAIMTIIGALAMCTVIFKISYSLTHTSTTSQTSKLMEKLRMIRTPILFVICYPILIITFEIIDIIMTRDSNDYTNSLIEFTTCVFQRFDGTSSSWQGSCGLHPKQRMDVISIAWLFFCVQGQSIIISSIYLFNPSVWRFWTRKLGISRTRTLTYIKVHGDIRACRKVCDENGSRQEGTITSSVVVKERKSQITLTVTVKEKPRAGSMLTKERRSLSLAT